MKRTINYSDWLPWEQNASPFLLGLTLDAGMRNLKQYIGAPLWTSVIIFEENQAKWLFRPKELKMLGQRMIDFLLCPPIRTSYFSLFERHEQEVIRRALKLQLRDLSQLPNSELIAVLDDFVHAYCDWYAFGWFCEPIQFQAQDLINAHLEKESVKTRLAVSVADARQALFSIDQESFSLEILRDLQECSIELEKA